MSTSTLPIRPWLPVGPEIVGSVVRELGAIAFPILKPEYARILAEEAEEWDYTTQPSEYGSRRVKQDLASIDVPPVSELYKVATHVGSELGKYFSSSAFETKLDFNFINVQRYLNGTVGIEPHYDESININLIVLLALRGTGTFRVYESIGGPVRVRWELTPGTLLIMAAPGFVGAKHSRPLHGVSDITGDPYRYLLGLRQQVAKGGERC